MRCFSTLLLALLALGCGAGTGQATGDDGPIHLPQPLAKPAFTLTDTRGRPWDFRARTDRQLTLLVFGYTHCPDVCPVHMANIAAALRTLPADLAASTRVVFVTTDPARDTPERLRTWLASFDPSFVGLRGTPEQTDRIQEQLGLPPAAVGTPLPGDSSYAVGHATQVIVFTPDNLAHVEYPFGTRQSDWARVLPRLSRGAS